MSTPQDTSKCSYAEFISLLTKQQSDLCAYIYAQLAGSSDVEDVLQKTNLTLWAKRDHFTLGTDFKKWSFRVARFEVLAHLKNCKRDHWLVFSGELAEIIADESEEKLSGSFDKMRHLEKCISRLRPQDQSLLRHRYQAGNSLREYAQQVGRSVSTLSVTLYRLRVMLKDCVEKKLNEEGGRV